MGTQQHSLTPQSSPCWKGTWARAPHQAQQQAPELGTCCSQIGPLMEALTSLYSVSVGKTSKNLDIARICGDRTQGVALN